MTRSVSATVGVFLLIAAASTVSAKGPTAMISIEGSSISTPLDIRDPAIERFHVWAGPGTRMNGVEGSEGFIVEWSSPLEAAPVATLPRYHVAFYTKQWNRSSQTYGGENLAYVVSYVLDTDTGQGYVYLPGSRDREYRLNVATIYRGSRWEGRWFRATDAWQKLVTPLLAAAEQRDRA